MTSPTAFVGIGVVLVGFVFVVVPRLLSSALALFRLERGLRAEKPERKAHVDNLDAYHHTVPAGERSNELNERTWRDLDLDDVFQKIDHTRSRVGQLYLRHVLRTPHSTREPLERLNRVVVELESDADSLAHCRKALLAADDPRAAYLVQLAYGDLPQRPTFWWIIPLLSLASIATLVWMAVDPRMVVVLAAVCLVNALTQMAFRRRMDAILWAIREVPGFIKTARALGALRFDSCAEEIETLRDGAAQLTLLERTTRWLSFDSIGESNEFLTLIYGYVNLVLLGDVNAFVFGVNAAKAAQPVLQRMFVAMGYIDVAQSIIEMRARAAKWCVPEFTVAEKTLLATGIVHPLLTNPVPNSLAIHDSSVLITGSNMSGKTTFVRALGVNAVFAQTLDTAFAARWCSPFLAVGASIGRMDNILEGKSYYLAEVESVGQLVREKGDGRQHLYLLDEIFRGTNTPERVAAAYAVLSHLNAGNDIVVVATHDIELLDMLGASYAAHHFREHIEADTLTFDFTIRDGRATTRNAIALLEVMKYPAEIVLAAREALDRRGS